MLLFQSLHPRGLLWTCDKLDADGKPVVSSPRQLASLLKLFGFVECVVLNACHSHAHAKAIERLAALENETAPARPKSGKSFLSRMLHRK